MALLWTLTGAAFLGLVLVYLRTRQLSRRLDRLAESYWDLRYEYGQLRARVTRLEPEELADGAPPTPGAPRAGGTTAFVPLSSLKPLKR